MVVDNVKMVEKVKDFLKYNSYLVWICFLLLCFSTIKTVSGLKEDMQRTNQEFKRTYAQMKKLLEKETNGIVILSNNGIATNSKKNFLDASTESSYNKAVKNILLNYLVFSNNELRERTGEIDKTYEILEYEPLREFQDNFLTHTSGQISTQGWKDILEYIKTKSNNNTMPNSINIINSAIMSYSWDTKKQTFDIEVVVGVDISFLDGDVHDLDSQIYHDRGEFNIKAKGLVDMKNNTVLNPLGIRFSELDLIIPDRKN